MSISNNTSNCKTFWIGNKVFHNGKVCASTADDSVWEPSVFN